MPQRIGRALGYALLIWITGFVWGSVVFMTPALKSVAAIPFVSRYPAISFPLLFAWPILTYLLARLPKPRPGFGIFLVCFDCFFERRVRQFPFLHQAE